MVEDLTDEQLDEIVIQEKLQNAVQLTLEDCLFCKEKREFQENVAHMEKTHGFFIPNREYLTDLEGLIRYLGDKISVGNVCLFCNTKSRYYDSMIAVRDHMNAVGHCKLAYEQEDLDEYADFYDFGGEEPYTPAQLRGTVLDVSDFSLTFINGKTIGHRSLAQYYKQKFRPAESREMVLANLKVAQAKAIGWHGNTQQLPLSTIEARQNKRYEFRQNKYQMDLGVQQNWVWRYRNENITQKNSGR